MFSGFSHSVMGASHEVSGTVCQDSSAYRINEYFSAAVVADGHGSKRHFRSNIGSKCAVEAALETFENFYYFDEEFESALPENHKFILKKIEKQIIANWNVKITRHLEENPVTEEEKSKFTESEFAEISPAAYYGTTLIAAVIGKNFTFGIQIGDGSLVTVMEDGSARMPMEYEESAPANITASMCNSQAATMFKSFYIDGRSVLAIYASTDGLYTSFGSEEDFLNYHSIITHQIVTTDDAESIIYKNLIKRSRYGTQDDVSMSCVCDFDRARELSDTLMNKVNEIRSGSRSDDSGAADL